MAQKYRVAPVSVVLGGGGLVADGNAVAMLPTLDLRWLVHTHPDGPIGLDAVRDRMVSIVELTDGAERPGWTTRMAERLLVRLEASVATDQARILRDQLPSAKPGVPLDAVGDFGVDDRRQILGGLRGQPPAYATADPMTTVHRRSGSRSPVREGFPGISRLELRRFRGRGECPR